MLHPHQRPGHMGTSGEGMRAMPEGLSTNASRGSNYGFTSIPVDERGKVIVEGIDAMDVQCMSHQLRQHHKWRALGRWAWHQWRQGRWVSSQPDYFLSHKSTQGKFKKVGFWMPRHFESDHRAIVAVLHAGKKQILKTYRRQRQ